MKRYLTRRAGLFALVFLITVISDLLIVGGSVLSQMLIDSVMSTDYAAALRLIGANIAYEFLAASAYIVSVVGQGAFSTLIADDMRRKVFSGIMKRSRSDFGKVNSSDYVSALTNDLRTIQSSYFGFLFLLFFFVGSMFFSALLMLYYQPFVALATVCCAAVMIFVPMLLGKRLGKLEKAHSEKLSALTTFLTEIFAGFEVVSSFGIKKHALKRFEKCSSELKIAEYRTNGLSSFSDGLAQLLSVMAQSAILGLSCYMVLKGRMSMGALVAFISLSQSFCGALSVVLRSAPVLKSMKPIIERVNGLADYEPASVINGAEPKFEHGLKADRLSFSYREGEKVLENASLELKPCEKYALTGGSGSGKTTLIRLLTGELDGYGGGIFYDGTELKSLDRESICSIVSVIHQDVFLFDDTVRNNICLFDEFSNEQFEHAVSLSGVKKFMSQLPDGADYKVGQRGERLSGGQRQRIAIARALIRNTPFLILDEGTSALDADTAVEIEKELMDIPGLTMLTITHNLRNPEKYDKILKLRNGNLVC
ncbi:MAG: ABC transporter ATP-binding protein [Oscillospiraceae bacterium]